MPTTGVSGTEAAPITALVTVNVASIKVAVTVVTIVLAGGTGAALGEKGDGAGGRVGCGASAAAPGVNGQYPKQKQPLRQ